MSNNHLSSNDFLKACLAAMLAIGLTACSSSSDNGTPPPTDAMEMVPTAYDTAKAAIAAAETAEAAQAAVDTAVAAGITGAQLQSLNMAVDARVAMLDAAAADAARMALVEAAACDAATAECIAAHDSLIAALQGDVDDLAADENATNAQQAAAQMALETAQATRNALHMQVTEIDRSTATGAAVGAAVDAANGLEDARETNDIAAAEMLLATAKGMLTDADDYAAQITAAEMSIARAKERNAVDAAIMAAANAVAGLETASGADAVTAAQMAIDAAKALVDNEEHLTDSEATAHTNRLADLQTPVTVARNRNEDAAEEQRVADQKAADEKAKEEAAANAKLGKAMYAALEGTSTAGTTALDNIDGTSGLLSSTGLGIVAAIEAGALTNAAALPSVTLKAGASAGALGSWNGTHYAHTNPGTKVVNAAVVYTNKGPAEMVPYAERLNALATANAGTAPALTAIKGYLTVTNDGTVDSGANITRVMADAFTHPGTQNHAVDGDTAIFTTRGTYDGAPGVYRCTGTCSSTNSDGKGAPSSLGGTWHFKPDAGASAMAVVADTTYLYYGWWLSKDKEGDPTAASAFAGIFGDGTSIQGGTTALDANPNALGGSATYAGNAVGKFAMSNALDGTGSGGHFTADATLTAKFDDTATGGVSGTIDNFMANGESMPWSVALHRAPWGTTNGAFASQALVLNDNIAQGTTWSIDGNSAPESGTWSGQMFDEMPGNAPDGDGSNVPTTATGTFYSEFSDVGRMVGAFGANKE